MLRRVRRSICSISKMEHIFALMHLLGFTFAPRIRDLHD
ncbi:TnpA family transposase [Rahnella inusitata]|nr:TnpA family transposase [Rahnella inusitata]